MIGSLRGLVLDCVNRAGQTAEVLIEVGGVGYRVVVPAGAVQQIGPPGAAAFLHIHTHVREDALVLYGFPTRDERSCFEALIGAHGVGPSVALALLSVHSPAALQRAVHHDDADALMLVPGIGKKTATRLLVELKSRLDGELGAVDLAVFTSGGDGSDPGSQGGGGGRDEALPATSSDADSSSSAHAAAATRADVRTALAGLGYGADEIRHALAGLASNGSLEDQLRAALRELAAVR